jgi:hypothetical protein
MTVTVYIRRAVRTARDAAAGITVPILMALDLSIRRGAGTPGVVIMHVAVINITPNFNMPGSTYRPSDVKGIWGIVIIIVRFAP